MAEAAAAFGLAAAVAQFVQLSIKVVQRLDQYQRDASKLPEALQAIKERLPLIQDALSRSHAQGVSGLVGTETQSALMPILGHCSLQVQALDSLLDKILPRPQDPFWKKGIKAIASIKQEKAIQQIMSSLHEQVGILTYHHVAPPLWTQTTQAKSAFSVPFQRDARFVGRANVIAELHTRLPKQHRVALIGIGGVGYAIFLPRNG